MLNTSFKSCAGVSVYYSISCIIIIEGMDVRNIVYMVLLTVVSYWWVHQFKQYILGSVELKGYTAIANYSKQTQLLYNSFTLFCLLTFTM